MRLFRCLYYLFFFFFNDTATTEIYTLSLHDALPISVRRVPGRRDAVAEPEEPVAPAGAVGGGATGSSRSEEHTSELQSLAYLVCRLLLEKKKKNEINFDTTRTSNPALKCTHAFMLLH